jgi:hypothetical protein
VRIVKEYFYKTKIEMKKILSTIFLFLITGISALANIQFTAKAPNSVAKDSPFNVTFTISGGEFQDFQKPDFQNFSVTSQMTFNNSGISSYNGQIVRREEISYIYTLLPEKEGTFTISPARITVDGKTVMSNALTIKVGPAGQISQSSQSARSGNAGQRSNQGAASPSVSDEDIFIKTELSKHKIYEQEPTVVTIKLFTRVDATLSSSPLFPDYKGFVTQEITVPDDKKRGTQVINGKKYEYIILRQLVLFPSKIGKLDIESGSIDVNVIVRNKVMTFWGPQNRDSYERKVLRIPAAKIEVTPLPASKPVNFSGGVGTFTLESSINNDTIKANEAVTIKLKINGNGNLSYLKVPEINFPADFETYEPKVDNKIKANANGTSGSKEIEYLAIPRFPGEFKIPPVEFSYFDIKSKQYKTLKTPEYSIFVEKGNGNSLQTPAITNYTNKEELKFLGEDIRFIDTKNTTIKSKDSFIFGTTGFWMAYLIPFFLFIILFILYRKKAKENANIALSKNKRANKQTRKRLKLAAEFLNAGNKNAFYEEILKALWGYTSDKLNIPLARLTKDNIESELSVHQVSQEVITEFMHLLNKYEFARFAPGENLDTMDNSYEEVVVLINRLEEEIKKVRI